MATKIEQQIEAIASPYQAFIKDQSAASICLFATAILALIAANSSISDSYYSLVHMPITMGIGKLETSTTLLHVINDGLMALFFFVLGLEIKRELLAGELQDLRQAAPVLAAAIGGMTVPALLYLGFNFNEPSGRGWGIPMATDSAFALGVLMLLGNRVPQGLKAFLLAYAIIDDLGAILVIALFYTETLNTAYLAAGGLCLSWLIGCNVIGLRHISIYLGIGLLIWMMLIGAGVHGTVAGVLVALAVPARAKRGHRWFLKRTRRLVKEIDKQSSKSNGDGILANPDQHKAVEAVEQAAKQVTTPLQRWERSLELPVLWLILPLFGLANAGIPLTAELLGELISAPLAWGIAGGLVVGKTLGISGFTWLAIRLAWGRLPDRITMTHIVGLALLGGMGFTMSIFIAGLTFSNEHDLYLAKAAILIASLFSGIAGYLWLRFSPRPQMQHPG